MTNEYQANVVGAYKKIDNEKQEIHLDCKCYAIEHSIRFGYSPEIECSQINVKGIVEEGKDPKYDDTIYVDKFLCNVGGFWHRVKIAFQYSFGMDREPWDFNCTLLKDNDFDKLIDFLKKIRNLDDVAESSQLTGPLKIDSYENTLIIVSKPMAEKGRWVQLDDVIIGVSLKEEESFFKRLWKGIKYIFGHKSNYGYTDEFEIHAQQAKHLIKILEEAKIKNEKEDLKNE
jgi:hypothetical protein